jgi:hypothetical protein
LARPLVLVALLALAACPLARADGDPASDYLLGQQTFVPPDIDVPPAYANQLLGTVRAAAARGYRIRVALIGSRYDLGAVTSLWKQPKRYARFLGQELYFVYKGRLLVVMPNGLGVSKGGKPVPAEQRVADRIAPPGTGGKALASTATRSVVRLAGNAGIVVTAAPLVGRTGSPDPNHDRLVISVAVLGVLFVGGVAWFARRMLREQQT